MNGVNWSLNGKITSDLLKCIFSYIVNGFVAQNDERHFFAIQCKVEITFSPENWATIAGSILRGYANSRLCKHPNVVWLNFAPSCKPHGQKCILIALLKKCILLALLKKCCKKRRKEKSTVSPREWFAVAGCSHFCAASPRHSSSQQGKGMTGKWYHSSCLKWVGEFDSSDQRKYLTTTSSMTEICLSAHMLPKPIPDQGSFSILSWRTLGEFKDK